MKGLNLFSLRKVNKIILIFAFLSLSGTFGQSNPDILKTLGMVLIPEHLITEDILRH